jgi:predicted deacetylase
MTKHPSRSLVSIEIHDVAPETWPRCVALLERLDAAGVRRTTLLVVPFYHRGVAIDRSPGFVDAISTRIARGDEIAVHGYVHLDEAAPPRTVRGLVERRMLTRGEGEFAAIDAADARDRVGHALAIWRRAGLPIGGFVPPAWLLGADARSAIASDSPFDYVALRGGIMALPAARWVATDLVWYSPTSAPRRWLSRMWIRLARARASPSRLLRLALHPQDADVRGVLDHWERIVASALANRCAVTTREALAERAPQRGAHSQYGAAL